jgi:threonine 3-dehydrogenase
MYDTWYKMLAMINSGLDLSGIITHRFPASEFQSAFDVMAADECGIVVLGWTNA